MKAMTVRELIKKLQQVKDEDSEVVIRNVSYDEFGDFRPADKDITIPDYRAVIWKRPTGEWIMDHDHDIGIGDDDVRYVFVLA